MVTRDYMKKIIRKIKLFIVERKNWKAKMKEKLRVRVIDVPKK